jgi:hypothetical protein
LIAASGTFPRLTCPTRVGYASASGISTSTVAASAWRAASAPSAASPGARAGQGALAGEGALPVLALPGTFTPARLQSLLAAAPAARAAFDRARRAGPATGYSAKDAQPGSEAAPSSPPRPAAGAPASPAQESCVAAAARAAGHPVRAAFLLDTVVQGRQATVLVAPTGAAGDQADVFAFPRGDCSRAPFAVERVG